jgi:hypothetical protein
MLSCVEGSCIPLNKYTFGCIWKKIYTFGAAVKKNTLSIRSKINDLILT